MSRRKAPLHDSSLLRKKDLGLTLTGTGRDRWGRKDQPGGARPWCKQALCFLRLEDEQAGRRQCDLWEALVLLWWAGRLRWSQEAWVPTPTLSK